MPIGKTFLFIALISFSVAGGFLLGQQTNIAVIAQKQPAKTPKIFDLIGKLRAEKISEIKVWGDEDERFYCVISAVDESPTEDSMFKTSDKLSIYDKSGKIVYESKDFGLGNLDFGRFLKSDESEIMFTTNGGGTDSFLNILSCKNGKFTEIEIGDSAQFRGGYFSLPQYRTGSKTAYFNPSQLIVIHQQGGADENPTASVLRTKDNKLQKVGEIQMRELGDFIESQVSQNNRVK
jgi:hypothetical protein